MRHGAGVCRLRAITTPLVIPTARASKTHRRNQSPIVPIVPIIAPIATYRPHQARNLFISMAARRRAALGRRSSTAVTKDYIR